MATRSPITDLAEYQTRLAAACWPIPMAIYKVAKSALYSGIMLVGLWLILRMDLQPTTTQIGLVFFFTFLTVLFVEVNEISIASTLASVTVSFAAPDEDEDDPD